MAPPDSQESRRRPAMLMAAVAGLVSVTAIACLVLVWPSAEPAAPAELLVMLFPLVSPAGNLHQRAKLTFSCFVVLLIRRLFVCVCYMMFARSCTC